MIEEKAYAKINLGLKIKRKREDGYHEIESLFLQINFYDIIRVGYSDRFEFFTNFPPFGEENLCVKVAKQFFQYTGLDDNVRIELDKRIWLGAGLGGGSSDAVATLKALNKLFGEPLDENQMKEICLGIGSDTLFFLKGGLCKVEGRGEIVKPLNFLPEIKILLINPGFSISTKWAYEEFDRLKPKDEEINFDELIEGLREKNIEKVSKNLKNDFEKVIFKHYPVYNEIKNFLIEKGFKAVSLSGSGSTLYALFF